MVVQGCILGLPWELGLKFLFSVDFLGGNLRRRKATKKSEPIMKEMESWSWNLLSILLGSLLSDHPPLFVLQILLSLLLQDAFFQSFSNLDVGED